MELILLKETFSFITKQFDMANIDLFATKANKTINVCLLEIYHYWCHGGKQPKLDMLSFSREGKTLFVKRRLIQFNHM